MLPLLIGFRGLMLPSPKLGVFPGFGVVIMVFGGQMLGIGGQVTAKII
jgi:hypothetical protein